MQFVSFRNGTHRNITVTVNSDLCSDMPCGSAFTYSINLNKVINIDNLLTDKRWVIEFHMINERLLKVVVTGEYQDIRNYANKLCQKLDIDLDFHI